MISRALLLVAVLVACEREPVREQKRPVEKCFADELGGLRPEWTVLEDCMVTSVECRVECINGLNGDACFNFAISLQQEEIKNDTVGESVEFFKRACKLGLSQGCTNWAAAQLFRAKLSPQCAYRIFDTTCAADDAFGCSMVGRLLIEWSHNSFDKWIGYGQLARTCDRLKGPPCRFLALYMERGLCGEPHRERIKSLMKLACEGEDDDACGEHATVEETMRGTNPVGTAW